MRNVCQEIGKTLTRAATIGICLTALLSCLASCPAGELRVGTAAVKITPPTGAPMPSFSCNVNCRGVLDDVYAKAVVFDDGRTKVALVACDLIGMGRSVVVEARRLIEKKTGIPAGNVMISATHTHTSPAVIDDCLLDYAIFASAIKQPTMEYTDRLPTFIAQAVGDALGRLVPAHISYGHEDEPNLSFIRRFWMKDGTVGWNPGKLNPNTLRPIGPIDPQVNVVYAETVGQRPLLTYVNFAMHMCTTGGELISADCPATLARRLADYKGPEMLTMFANGACGNINHLNVNWADPQASPQEAKRLGTILAAAVLKSYMNLQDAKDLTLRVRRQVVPLPLIAGEFSAEEIRKSQEIVARHGANTPFLELVKACRVLDLASQHRKPVEVEVQVVGLGQDIAWVALPGEVFVELGLSIKAASPFRQTSVIELANGASYYIPNRSAYTEGQYEVVSTPYAEGAGEMLVTTAIRMLAELHCEANRGTADKTVGPK